MALSRDDVHAGRAALTECVDRLLDRAQADLDERLKKHVHAMAIAEADTVLRFVDGLRARGVLAFKGLGLELALAEAPPAPPRPTPGQPHVPPVSELLDAGGGLMVDPDALGHEA